MPRAWVKVEEEGVAVVTINVGENLDTISLLTANHSVTFPLSLDPDATVVREWPVKGLPRVVDSEGRIVCRATGGREWDDRDCRPGPDAQAGWLRGRLRALVNRLATPALA
jgi:hypothetical protein